MVFIAHIYDFLPIYVILIIFICDIHCTNMIFYLYMRYSLHLYDISTHIIMWYLLSLYAVFIAQTWFFTYICDFLPIYAIFIAYIWFFYPYKYVIFITFICVIHCTNNDFFYLLYDIYYLYMRYALHICDFSTRINMWYL